MQENIIKKIIIKLPADFKEVLNKINENALGIVFVVDDKGHLIGSISDGDIRRAMLKGMNLEDSISMTKIKSNCCKSNNLLKTKKYRQKTINYHENKGLFKKYTAR